MGEGYFGWYMPPTLNRDCPSSSLFSFVWLLTHICVPRIVFAFFICLMSNQFQFLDLFWFNANILFKLFWKMIVDVLWFELEQEKGDFFSVLFVFL